MLSPQKSQQVLLKLFRGKFTVNLDELFNVLETKSRMSVFRRLKLIGYLTSYTDAGRYYTLKSIPSFDTFGLWFYKEIGFSKVGTLKSTVTEIVKSSPSGMTPKDLINILKLRVPNTFHNTLHGLVKVDHLCRHRVEGLHLYTDTQSDKDQMQIMERRQEMESERRYLVPLTIETTIAVLVEALKAGEFLVSPSTISERLGVRGIRITEEQIQGLFSQYGINAVKKTIKQP